MADKKNDLKDVAALKTMIELFEDLDDGQREWVINSLISRFQIPFDSQSGDGVKGGIDATTAAASGNSGRADLNLTGFLAEKGKVTRGCRAALIAYWATKNRVAKVISLKEISEWYGKLGEPEPDRLDMTIRNATLGGKKLFKPAGRGSYELTFHGQALGVSKAKERGKKL